MITRDPVVNDPNHTVDHGVINGYLLDYFPVVIVQDGVGGATKPRPPTTTFEGGRVLWLLFDSPGAATWPSDIHANDLVGNMRSVENPWA
jgi:hypothetical protein